ncbi:CAP domain-containing protein [Saccharopolyspora griseoalba]|uniref:CAP domain-containing protein n=1 Tax=Saccharopolyspora griseoalba TaxID=1431848 RepID=A0ABW2LGP8_9PSEU
MNHIALRSAVVSAIVLGSTFVPVGAQAKSVEGSVLSLVNVTRADAGCEPLRLDHRLNRAASAHSADMSRRGYFSHTTPEGVTFGERIRRAGYPKPGAENIARGQTSARQVVDDWLASSGHRENIVNCELRAVGIGVSPDGQYWTQDFGY